MTRKHAQDSDGGIIPLNLLPLQDGARSVRHPPDTPRYDTHAASDNVLYESERIVYPWR